MWNGLSTDDMCIDYKLRFGVKFNKLHKGDVQLGIFFNKQCFSTYVGDMPEYYLYLCFFKWGISIGWFLEEDK